jgi:hypothetical protein
MVDVIFHVTMMDTAQFSMIKMDANTIHRRHEFQLQHDRQGALSEDSVQPRRHRPHNDEEPRPQPQHHHRDQDLHAFVRPPRRQFDDDDDA